MKIGVLSDLAEILIRDHSFVKLVFPKVGKDWLIVLDILILNLR